MEIGEQYLPAPQSLALVRERLLDLHDQLGFAEYLIGPVDQTGAGATIVFIGKSGADPGAAFDQDRVTVMRQFAQRTMARVRRGIRDP